MNKICLNATTADDLGIGIFRYQMAPGRKFISANTEFSRLFGFPSVKDLQKAHIEELFTNEKDRETFLNLLNTQKKVKFFETTYRRKSGKTICIAVSANLIANGRSEKYVEGVIQNITQFKQAHEKLLLEIDTLQGFLDSMPDAIYFKDRKNRITRVNKFYAKGVGMSPEDIYGKTDFDFFPADQAELMAQDDNSVLKTGQPIIAKVERTILPNGTWNQVLTTKIPMYDRAGKIVGTMGITRDMTAHANLERERFSMMLNAFAVLGKALEMRDPYTYAHTRFVARIAQTIGKEFKFNEDQVMQIKLAAELHDLGKISIPLDILIKPGKLNDIEFRLVREHVENCYSLIKGIDFPFPLAEIIYQHHERLDGSGYPRHLKGKQILFEARILAVSDVLEAMTSRRPYREALGIHRATVELQRGSGTKYDPEVVKVALNLIRKSGGKPFWQENGSDN